MHFSVGGANPNVVRHSRPRLVMRDAMDHSAILELVSCVYPPSGVCVRPFTQLGSPLICIAVAVSTVTFIPCAAC